MVALRLVALAAPAVAFQAPRCAAPQLLRQHLFGNKNKPGDDGKYESLAVDVAAYEALEEPLVAVGESDGRGRGVFAVDDIAAGTTITEYVGMLAATPETRTDDLALYQNYYGKDWRLYSQRYEIGLTGTKVADAGGLARGGAVEHVEARGQLLKGVEDAVRRRLVRGERRVVAHIAQAFALGHGFG